MGRIVGGLFGTVVVGTTLFAMNAVFIGFASVLRLVPLAAPLVGKGLWGILVFSCRLYYLLLTRLAPFVEKQTRIQLLTGLWRLGTTLVLSLVLGLALLLAARLPLTFWTIIPFLLHGLFVDFVWDEIPGLGALQMGVRM